MINSTSLSKTKENYQKLTTIAFSKFNTLNRTSVVGVCVFFGWLWEFYILAASNMSYQDGYRLMTVHTHGDFRALARWEIRPPVSWPQYPTRSHYPDTELTSPFPIQTMLRTRLGNDKYQFDKSLGLTRSGTEHPTSRTRGPRSTDSATGCVYLFVFSGLIV